ncbi:MAG TPA: RHS repeat-associated core domain-containing protein [Puia sp.]|uniref:RHS repeat-associated core domain-containing protein n=1 Tax=Puia sp. TaxID=2045100 RepID=UPI002B6A9142|nr:RHS repeat-associated core domain-containing protein [Puia sp.]HVU99126.1 RHS repeat-associated core domain-containing protein [Puia sp.]
MQVLRTYITRLVFGCTLLFLGMATVQAGNGDGDGGGQVKALAVLDGSLHQIKPDSSATVVDSSFFDPSLSGMLNKGYVVQNAVTVSINEALPRYLHTHWTATVKLLISWTDSTGATDSVTHSFTVGYDSIGTYNSRNTYTFQGGHRVTVKVISDSTDATGWDPMSVLLVENQLSTRPDFIFNCRSTIGTITVGTIADTADELPVSWNAVLGADVYDLEWTYVYDSALKDGRYGAAPNYNPGLIFRNNATRVTISGTSYNIPLIYDDYGTLFIRVRPVKMGSAGSVTSAIWSSDASPVVMGSYAFNGHERPLNWQSNISFAEEGKRKVVLQYYDGSLRSRQTVTKDNTTNTTIVGETYYDYQGRPSIQVMPAPTLSNVIKYTAGFNVSFNSPEYSQSNFDTLSALVPYCEVHADSMNSTAGASQYYSPNNPQANLGLNQFIPNAENYPFTETEYTPDNTGRINRQGGVGRNHQLGSGHETKYFYGTPDQYELDALFGTEVGDKSHYFKNMVRDANGQYSVSYVDMHGRTIATALSGAQPQGMAALPSKNVKTITETLADSGTASVRGLSMISQKTLVVSQADSFRFSYSLLPDSLQQANCQNANICYTCRYDLDITITDNCNNQLLGGAPYTVSQHNFTPATLANSCDNPSMSFQFTVLLPEGSYVVTKKLTVNSDAYNYYRDSIYMPNNTCTSFSQLLTQQKSVIASKLTSCTADCSTCLANVGTFAAFLASYNAALGLSPTDTTYKTEATAAYNSALSACSAVCQTSTDVDDIRTAMLQDMTPPFGQYADSSRGPAEDQYSIFYLKPSSSSATDTGYVPVFKLPAVRYLDANGKPDSVYDVQSGLMLSPNSLTKEQFVADFRPSWAEALLPYHPDYCRLQVMITDSGGYSYDRKMQSVDTYDAAVAAGYVNPLNLSDFNAATGISYGPADPLPTNNPHVYDDLKKKIGSYMTLQKYPANMNMWGVAVAMVKCGTDEACFLSYSTDRVHGTYKYGFDNTSLCDGDKDMAWRNFRQMYLQAKQDIVYNDLLTKPSPCTVFNTRVYNSEPSTSTLLQANHTSSFTQMGTLMGQTDGPLKYLNGVSSPTDASNAQAKVTDSLNFFYDANVNAYGQQWYSQLTSSCTVYDTNDVKATLIPALKALCRMACDGDHPYGASTLPSGMTYTFEGVSCTSFTQIINQYNLSKSITDQVHCNAELINSPLPYDNQPVYSVKPEYGRPSNCECSIITGLHDQFLAANRDASFSAFLSRTQMINMADSDLNTLMAMCSNTTNTLSCLNNPKPIYLPPMMQCHTGQTCSSCQQINALYASFQVAYPGIVPSDSSDTDTAQATKNRLFQNYMNNRLGYSLQFWEYLQFMDTCKAHAADTATSSSCAPTVIAQTFTSGGNDNMIDIRATADGGYALAGYKTISGVQNAYLMRYNSTGQVQWAKTYSSPGGSNFWKVRVTSDGGFIAAGAAVATAGSSNGRVLVVKTDAAGNTLWQNTYGFDSQGEQAFDIIQTSDGGYALVGDHNLTAVSFTGPAAMLCMKIDSLGTLQWAESINGGSSGDGYAVAQNKDTLVFLGRQWRSGFGDVHGVLVKLSRSTGAVLSQLGYTDSTVAPNGGDYGMQIYGIAVDSNGYRISDYVSYDGGGRYARYGYMKVGYDGSVQRAVRIHLPPGNGSTETPRSGNIVPTPDGGWLNGQATATTPHIFWTRFDSLGNQLWSRETNIDGSQDLGSVVENANKTYTVLGINSGAAMVLNLDTVGAAGCKDAAASIGFDTANIVIDTQPETASSLSQLDSMPALTETPQNNSTDSTTCAGTSNCFTVYNGPLLCGKSQPALAPAIPQITTCSDSTFFSVSTATSLFRNYSDSLTGDFEQRYLAKCMNAYRHETFTVTHGTAEYHYTLYYYDQAGNLLKTVPPAGVQQMTDTVWLKSVAAARAAGTTVVPHHTLVTNYRYNTLNQVVTQRTPDGGGSRFWYDRLGRLAVSQNARQNPNNQYSYTEYDTIGRIVQVGQLSSSTAISDAITRSQSSLASWLTGAASSANQITTTTYDVANALISNELGQRNTRNRVSWTSLYNTAADLANGSPNATASSYFTYDILGNVDTLVQDYGNGHLYSDVANVMNTTGNRFKKIVYDFDLVSGKVNQVSYQGGYADAFYHSYQYDAENRITNVQSSTDSVNWENDAFYQYYKHGPLARTVLGQQQVQGVNYAYTLQGWLKAINPDPYTGGSFTLRPDSAGNVVANNAYSLLLNYFDGDFKPISNVAGPDNGVSTTLGAAYAPLYNGNISSMGVNIKKLNAPLLYNYQYDQLNRLTNMDAWNRTSTAWNALTATTDFHENVSYDANGNILTYHRNRETPAGGGGNQMDKLQYNYIPGTNQLDHIYDTAGATGIGDLASQSSGNYKYDSIGELIGDAASNISNITWTVYGKIAMITKPVDTTIRYTYDPAGNRISKTVSHGGDSTTTWYVRDGQGNILSVYTSGDAAVNGGGLAQTELDVYGGSRLGVWNRTVNVVNLDSTVHSSFPKSGDSLIFTRGSKLFELTNHLGNVLATISDKRYGVSVDDSTVAYYNSTVVSASDYYPFGMMQYARSWPDPSARNYRFGFNGKENDNDVKGAGNQIDYGMRVYDPRIAKFQSIDPLQAQYPELTPYQFGSNSPISHIDRDGLEKYHYTLTFDKGKPALSLSSMEDITARMVVRQYWDGQGNIYSEYANVKNPYQEYDVTYSWDTYVTTEVFAFPAKEHVTVEVNSDPTKLSLDDVVDAVQDAIDTHTAVNEFRQGLASGFAAHRSLREQIEPAGTGRAKTPKTTSPTEEVTNKATKAVHGGLSEADKANTATVSKSDIPAWNGPVDYSKLPEPRKVGPGLETTVAQRQRILDYNRKMNGGYLRSDIDGTILDPPTNVAKGQKANMNQAEVDHKTERVNGGSNSNSNQRVISKKQNLEKETQRRKVKNE